MLAAAAEQGLVLRSAGRLAGAVPVSGQLDAGLHPHPVAAALDAHRLSARRGRRAVPTTATASSFPSSCWRCSGGSASSCWPCRCRLWWPGLLLVGLALALHLAGYMVQQPRISIVALFTGIYGLMGLAWGRAMAARELLPVLPVRLLRAAGVVGGVDHLSPAAAGVPAGGVDFRLVLQIDVRAGGHGVDGSHRPLSI